MGLWDRVRYCTWTIVWVVVSLGLFMLPGRALAAGQFRLKVNKDVRDLLPLIKTNEALFRDLEVKYRCEYTLLGGKLSMLRPAVVSQSISVHQITQGDLYWFDYDHHGITRGGDKTDESYLTGYDGKSTRSWIQHTYGDLFVGQRWENPLLFRPHGLLSFHPGITLSKYIENGDEGRKKDVGDGTIIEESIKRLPDAIVIDRQCHVLESTITYGGDFKSHLVGVARLWICPEANYLPVKAEFYIGTRPNEERLTQAMQVDALQEIEPGVWLPKKASQTVYEDITLINKTEWSFETPKLRPHYPTDRFGQIEFPHGVLVHMIRDGQIVRSYHVGEDVDVPGLAATRPSSPPTQKVVP